MIALEKKRSYALEIIKKLQQFFPQAGIVLNYSNNWELLVAVILSAQCTDKQVNKVTARLFKKYTALNHYLAADLRSFEQDIKSTGFYRNKAKNILAAARLVYSHYHGQIPRQMSQLLTLPGVGRKTANVVLGNAYNIIEGIAVDTHVARLSQKLGLTSNCDPKKIEADLMKIIPKKDWFRCTYLMIEYGRRYCPARRHDHQNCPLTKVHGAFIAASRPHQLRHQRR